MRSLNAALLLCLASMSLTAQESPIAAEIRAGDSLEAALHPEAAAVRFRAALALDSTNDPADHVLGAWNAEIKRLSGFTRFFAKTLFGAGFMDKANWDDAQRYLVRAIALNPRNVYHRLELAQVYVDVHKYAAAREQLTALHDLPIADVLDHKYKKDAEALLDDIRNKKEST